MRARILAVAVALLAPGVVWGQGTTGTVTNQCSGLPCVPVAAPNGGALATAAGQPPLTAPGTPGGTGITVTDPATLAISGKLPSSGNGADSTVTTPTALTQLATFTVANPGAYHIQNQSALTIQYQMCATGGTGCTIFLLAGVGANMPGQDTSPPDLWFTGVINVLGATGAQFAARHN